MGGLTARVGGICAALFAVLFVIGIALLTDSPDSDAPDADYTKYVNDSGNLSAFPADYATGTVDPTASWATNEAHSYKFVVTVQDNNSAQGSNCTAGFTWEARNT